MNESVNKAHIKYNEESIELKQYLDTIGLIPLLTAEDEKILFMEYKRTSDKQIKQKIISSNLKLVVNVAKRYLSAINMSNIEFFDIIQSGNMGLIDSIDNFDVTLGYRFSTFAVWYIKRNILTSLNDMGKEIKIANNKMTKYLKIKNFIDNYVSLNGFNPTLEEISNSLGYDIDIIKTIQCELERNFVSLNEYLNEENETCLEELIPSDEISVEELVEEKIIIESIKEVMPVCLTNIEYKVMSLRYGFINEFNCDSRYKPLDEVGKILNLTKEGVRVIEARALSKIKKQLNYQDADKIKRNIKRR